MKPEDLSPEARAAWRKFIRNALMPNSSDFLTAYDKGLQREKCSPPLGREFACALQTGLPETVFKVSTKVLVDGGVQEEDAWTAVRTAAFTHRCTGQPSLEGIAREALAWLNEVGYASTSTPGISTQPGSP